MKIIKSISDIKKTSRGCVLTIGNFDGVHLGHQQILTAARKITNKRMVTPIQAHASFRK